jgi:hypothetical protein
VVLGACVSGPDMPLQRGSQCPQVEVAVLGAQVGIIFVTPGRTDQWATL